ncbi:MAG: pilus assembly protein TadG-related protein [Planctomycetota bacterium]|nr:pilus assembly protein TadG-related protein [Planctomycetota bacterium]
MKRRQFRRKRNGNILVLSAVLMVMIMAMLAFAVDLGYLYVAREEMQRSADSAALAAAWDLVDSGALTGDSNVYVMEESARGRAAQYASLNQVLRQSPALANQDIAIGFLSNPSDPTASIDLSGMNTPNTVWVRVRRTESQNGRIPFFMANVLGIDSIGAEVEATASLLNSFQGFQTPSSGNLAMLPFALDQDTWYDLVSGIGTDDWKWDAAMGQVQAGADGILELNLYPQGTGSPGNRGTIDIGSNNNSTADIARQIVEGISPSDLSYHGGKLEFDCHGELPLNGDTGISAGVKDELESIKGEPRIIPIFSQVSGPGNNATYTIVQFAGIRIMEVNLTGSQSSKRVVVQPANIVARGGIPSPTSGTTAFVYSPVWLVR